MKLHLEPGGDANLSGEERDVTEHYEQQLGELCSCLRQLRSQWEQYLENLDQRHVFMAYQAHVVPASGRGRPRFDITRDQLEYLSLLSFNWTQIATLVGVSRMTIYRRRTEFGMLQDVSGRLTNDEVRRHVTQFSHVSDPSSQAIAPIGCEAGEGSYIALPVVAHNVL